MLSFIFSPFFLVRQRLARLARWPRGLWGLLALLLPACTDPYSPTILTAPRNFLVVDGFINSQGSTTIRLSRTFAISAMAKAPVEGKASLTIQDNTGMAYPLQEKTPGTYVSAALALSPARQYRLHIRTLAGLEYASDYAPVKNTPPIDNVTWRIGSDGMTFYVSAHDDTQATRYYRWEYDETWETSSPFAPYLEYANHQIQPRTVPLPSVCWVNVHSSVIQLAKTTALTKDVVSEFALRVLPRNTERLSRRYSLLVQQHALTKEEYEYWELLRKNTESIGTLFDPLPVQVTGNVHCLSNATETTLGFVGVHSLPEKRLFISRADLPISWPLVTGYEKCVPPDTVLARYVENVFGLGTVLPLDPVTSKSGRGYTAASAECVDCRTRGSATKPTYW